MKGEMKVAKKVKKLEEVKPVEEEVKEEATEVVEDIKEDIADVVEETPVEEVPTEAELPKVEFNEEIAPKGYSTIIPHIEDKNPLKMKNGRVYQEVGNGCGMFLDNGAVFRLEEK